MNTLVLPVIERGTNKTTQKINDIIIEMPEKEKIDSMKTRYSDMSAKYKKAKRRFAVTKDVFRLLMLIFLISFIGFMTTVIILKENYVIAVVIAVGSIITEIIFAFIFGTQCDNLDFLDDSLYNMQSLLMFYDFTADNNKHLSLYVFDKAKADGLYLFDTNDLDSDGFLTHEADNRLKEKYPDGHPEVSLKYIETEDRNAQPTLTIDTETDSVVFTAPINYRMFLNEDSVFSIWI